MSSPDNDVPTSGPVAKTELSEHERKMITDLNVISRAVHPKLAIVSTGQSIPNVDI